MMTLTGLERARAVAIIVGYLARSARVARLYRDKTKRGDRLTEAERAEAVKVSRVLQVAGAALPAEYSKAMEVYYG